MEWGECPESKKGTRMRLCNNPVPVFGGAFCKGKAVDAQNCGEFMLDGTKIT